MPIKTMFSNPANPANPAWNPVTAVRVVLALAAAAAAALVTVLAVSLTAAPPAQAQSSCQNDFGIIQGKREKQIAALNAMAKRSRGKLDPAAACPRLRALAATETEMLTYMRKNKAWCSIPDELIAQVEKGRAGTQNMAGQACKVAGQIAVMKRRAAQQQRQMQQQDAAAAAARPKLPSGPL